VSSINVYLSRLILDLGCRQVLSELAQPYEMHRTLMKAFPTVNETTEPRAHFGVLFRAEVDESKRIAKVYVQSNVQPDWSFLCVMNSYLVWDRSEPPYECKDITKALQSLRVGQTVAFKLRANPTKRLARDGDPLKGKRVALLKEEDQIEWLQGKGRGDGKEAAGGFELVTDSVMSEHGESRTVPRVRARVEGNILGKKKGSEGRHLTTHFSVLFEGLLRITDPDVFLDTVRRGIGPGKAYGFGLLSLGPARS